MNTGYRIKSPFEQKGRLFLCLGIEFVTNSGIMKRPNKFDMHHELISPRG